MGLKAVKSELETCLGHPVSYLFYLKCLRAFEKGRHGPVGLGGFAFFGYCRPFQDALGDEYNQKIAEFFCGHDQKSERVRALLSPGWINNELLPKKVSETLHAVYGYEPYYRFCDDWYQRFARYFLELGIPEEGVAGIIKKHPIDIGVVEHAKKIQGGITPEGCGRNVLKYRHRQINYDDLAVPKIRITHKRIADYREQLRQELRQVWTGSEESLRQTIWEECCKASDEYIASLIKNGTTPGSWARQLDEL